MKFHEKVELLISKMDEDEAALFATMILSDYVEEQIENNLEAVQKHLDRVVSKRLEMVQTGMVSAVSKSRSADALEYAAAFAEIKKAATNQYAHGAIFDESKFNRGRDGRFRTKIAATAAKKPMPKKSAEALGVRHNKDFDKLSRAQQARYQSEYAQLSNFLQAVQESTGGDADVFLHYQQGSGDSATTYTEKVTGTKPKTSYIDPKAKLIGVEARPNQLNVGGAVFGLSSALGANGTGGGRAAAGLNAYERNFPEFRDTWLKETDPRSSTAGTYNRIAASSKLIGDVNSGKTAQQISAVGQFIGSHGPEAEQVFGPGVRRTAYRYRGVTKTPDDQLTTVYDRAGSAAKLQTNSYRAGSGTLAPVQQAAARISAERRDTTWDERENGRSVVRAYLARRLPQKELYELQLASGTTPPSEGVIIDASGKIVAQAVGYGDDHYLPFNLKNLSKVKGGEYIRTRSAGGPTAEDIYTGLMTGAKQLTVVSRSGSFIVKFHDDFKGGRRYNDKALRMTKRYQQLLDAVQSQQVDRQDVKPSIRAALAAQVREKYSGYDLSSAEMAKIIGNRVEEFKSSPDLSEEDYALADYMNRVMEQRVAEGSLDQRAADNFRKESISELAAEKEYKFRLNSAGYEAALTALQEQFPYYLEKPKYIPPRDNEAVQIVPEMDRGYVEPGRNRPTAARAGLFGTQVNPGQKFSASQADYQGRRSAARGGTEDGPKESSLKPTGEQKPEIKNVVQEAQRRVKFVAAAQSLQQHAMARLDAEAQGNFEAELGYSPEELSDPLKQQKFDKFATQYLSQVKDPQLSREYTEAAGHIGQASFDPEMAGVWPAKAYTFPTSAKMPENGALTATKKLAEMTDGELEAEHTATVAIKTALKDVTDPEDRVTLLQSLGVPRGNPGTGPALANLDGHLTKIHQVRFLNAGVADDQRMAPMVMRPAAQSKEEAASVKENLEQVARGYDSAAQIYARMGEDEKADQLYAGAQQIHDQMKGPISNVEAEALKDSLNDLNLLAVEAFQRRRTGGSILS